MTDKKHFDSIPVFTREELFNMSTTDILFYNSKIVKVQEMIKSELICRGEY